MVRAAIATWHYDPEGPFEGTRQILPFGRAIMDVTRPAIDAGAVGFVGALTGYPGDSCRYYVPYDAQRRDIHAVWVSGSDGKRLREMLAAGPVQRRVSASTPLRATSPATTSSANCPAPTTRPSSLGRTTTGRGPRLSRMGPGSRWCSRRRRTGPRVPAGRAAAPAGVPPELGAHGRRRRAGDLRIAVIVTSSIAACSNCTWSTPRTSSRMRADHFGRPDSLRRAGGSRRGLTGSRPPCAPAIEAEDLRRSFILRPDVFGPKPTTDGADFHLGGGAARELPDGAVLPVR